MKRIVFSAPLIGPIAAGTKRVTRRLAPFKSRAPYGPGDVLGVAETLRRSGEAAAYAADGAPVVVGGEPRLWTWKRDVLPGRFCPTLALRYFVRVESVTLERLDPLSVAEAEAEGVETPEAFVSTWDRLHRGVPFASRPWVWRIAFHLAREAR